METDCFWCGTVYNANKTACPHCATPTGEISIVISKD